MPPMERFVVGGRKGNQKEGLAHAMLFLFAVDIGIIVFAARRAVGTQ